jgi:TolB-like protein/tetratricopeptide (TPR) repeat protein
MAPEQAAAEEAMDQRADVYAVGAMAYELLTGRPPFSGGSAQQILAAQVTKTPQPVRELRPSVPEALSELVMRCLEKKPENRWQRAEEMLPHLEGPGVSGQDLAPETGHSVARPGPPRRTVLSLAAALVALLVMGTWVSMGREGGFSSLVTESPVPMLAVLPFDNITGDTTQLYLAEGVTETLTTSLAKIGGLDVISRASVMGFRRERPPLPEVARDLHADFLMEGSVFRVQDQVQITARLIQGGTDRPRWSEVFAGDLSDFPALLAEVARGVAGEMEVLLTGEDEQRLGRTPSTSAAVMDALLRARHLIQRAGTDDLEQAIRLLEESLDIDPSFAPAWGLLARAHLRRGVWWGGHESFEGIGPEAERAARRALALDSADPDVQFFLARHNEYRFEWEEAEAAWREVLRQDPSNFMANLYLANLLTAMGRLDEAEARARGLLRIAPLDPQAHLELYHVLTRGERTDEALPFIVRAVELDPDFLNPRVLLTGHLAARGRCEDPGSEKLRHLGVRGALTEAERLLGEVCPDLPICLCNATFAFSECGRPEQAEDLLRKVEERARTEYVSPIMRARMHLMLGERERALQLLEEGVEARDLAVRWTANGFWLRSLRGDPRYEAVVDRIGLPREEDWLAPQPEWIPGGTP